MTKDERQQQRLEEVARDSSIPDCALMETKGNDSGNGRALQPALGGKPHQNDISTVLRLPTPPQSCSSFGPNNAKSHGLGVLVLYIFNPLILPSTKLPLGLNLLNADFVKST